MNISVILFVWLGKISHHINKKNSIKPYFQGNNVPLRFLLKANPVDKIIYNIEAPKQHPVLIIIIKFALCGPKEL